MASNNLLVVLAIAVVVFPSVTMATEYWVGDSKGWTVNFDYQAWASDKMFMVGDVLGKIPLHLLTICFGILKTGL